MTPRLGSLFTGAAGLDMAVEEVFGTTTAWHAEVDPAALRVLAHRFPNVPNLGDVTAVDWAAVEPVDVLCGGSPCQDVSHAGMRAGMRAGTRSGLWAAMCDAIETIRPAVVVWENVRGVLSAEADSALEPCPGCVGDGPGTHLRALGRVLGDLAELGYVGGWCGLRAADIGAPHSRFRVFVVAADAREQRCDRFARVKRSGGLPSVRGEAGDNPGHPGQFSATDTSGDGWDEGRPESEGFVGGSDAAECGGAPPAHADGDALRLEPVSEPRRGRATLAGFDVQWGQYEPAIRRWERVLGRPAPRPTEPGARGAERLSPRLTEWMMGWPDGWVTDVPGISRNDALKICGNGVVPQQASEALRRLTAVRERAA